MGFYKPGTTGTVTGPAVFDPEDACTKLFEGMKGLGTDEDAVVDVVASHTNEQRQIIKEKYESIYEKDLERELESELSGSFLQMVLALMKEPEDYILETINQVISKKSMKIGQIVPRSIRQKLGLGADEFAIIGLLCPRTNEEVNALKKAYRRYYKNHMDEDFADDWGKDFRSLIVGLLKGGRDESGEISALKIQEDVEAFRAVVNGHGNKDDAFKQIFTQRSYQHMRVMFDAFKEYNRGEKDIEGLIEDEFSGRMQAAYIAMVRIIQNEKEFYAERLNEALMGAGTDDDTLIRIIVMRSEIDLKDIMDIYEKKYNRTLMEDVVGDTSGDYQNILAKLLTPGEPRETPVEEEITTTDAGEGEESVPQAEEEAVEEDNTPAMEDEEALAVEEEVQTEAVEEIEEAKVEEKVKEENAENGEADEVKGEVGEEEKEEVKEEANEENEGEEEANVAKEGEEEATETNEEAVEEAKETNEEGEVEAKEVKEEGDEEAKEEETQAVNEEGGEEEAKEEETKEEITEAATENEEGEEKSDDEKEGKVTAGDKKAKGA